jgi:ABC-type Na+ transport system ATPase subunit NatA
MLGETGAGKTTTILHITGAKLKLDEDKENIVCVNHEKDFTIGVGTKSETKYISVKTIQNESTNYEIWYVIDSPLGFKDTEGQVSH